MLFVSWKAIVEIRIYFFIAGRDYYFFNQELVTVGEGWQWICSDTIKTETIQSADNTSSRVHSVDTFEGTHQIVLQTGGTDRICYITMWGNVIDFQFTGLHIPYTTVFFIADYTKIISVTYTLIPFFG